jgi:hypothetical protein
MSTKITEAQASWLYSVKAGDVTLCFPWGSMPPYYNYAGSKARDLGVLKRLRAMRLIEDTGTVTGRLDHLITLTNAGREALEAYEA